MSPRRTWLVNIAKTRISQDPELSNLILEDRAKLSSECLEACFNIFAGSTILLGTKIGCRKSQNTRMAWFQNIRTVGRK